MEVYMPDNLVKINLGFENVCGINIPAKYIRNLRIADVTQHSSYDCNLDFATKKPKKKRSCDLKISCLLQFYKIPG